MRIKDDKWVHWLIAACTLVASVCAWAMTNFETKDHAKEVKADHYREFDSLHSDINSMDKKIDRLLLRSR